MKKIHYIILLVLSCICLIIAYPLYKYYSAPQLRQTYLFQEQPDNDTINIAFIGDSWAFRHKNHSCKIGDYIESVIHKPVRVYSYGINGLTSKEIYERMYVDDDFIHFMQQKQFDYCYLSAGINDTYKKMSTSYYQKSIDNIIQLLFKNHIHPIIQEIPDYDIHKAYDRQKYHKKILRQISSFINGCPLDCKDMYRNALNSLIFKNNYNNRVSILRYQTWNNNSIQDQQKLYLTDGMHLNEYGYIMLDRAIANEIIKLILK